MRRGGKDAREARPLVRYFGICTEGPEQLLLTEFAQYGSLDHFLETHEGQVRLPHKLKMIDQICAVMIVITSMEMIHRDLSTRNMLSWPFGHDGSELVVPNPNHRPSHLPVRPVATNRVEARAVTPLQQHATVEADHRWRSRNPNLGLHENETVEAEPTRAKILSFNVHQLP